MTEHAQTDPIQRSFSSRKLLENLDAEPRLLHHAPNAPNLTLDTIETRDERLLLCIIQHE
jgi:hypothetical protein